MDEVHKHLQHGATKNKRQITEWFIFSNGKSRDSEEDTKYKNY